MTMTEAFRILGINPIFVYCLTFLCLLFVLTDKHNLAQALVVALAPAYISALTVLFGLGGVQCLPLNEILVILPAIAIIHLTLEGILGFDKYAELVWLVRDKIISLMKKLRLAGQEEGRKKC